MSIKRCIGTAALVCAFTVGAQQTRVERRSGVEGFRGEIETTYDRGRGESVLVFRTKEPRVTRSSRVVAFLLQHESGSSATSWKGDGRLLLGRGFVGWEGDDGTKKIFLLSGHPLPPSLAGQGLEPMSVFGIARHGFSQTLTEEHIQQLRLNGNCKLGERRSLEAGCANCTSGGPGSTSCEVEHPGGRCAVECGDTYHACCNSQSLNCRCCKNEGD